MTRVLRWWFLSFRADDQIPARRNTLRQVETYEVERQQFDNIEQEATGIGTAFAMACACLPVAVTLNVTLKTASITDGTTATAVWTLMWACYILGLFFSIEAWRKRGHLRRFMLQIRDAQIEMAAKNMPSLPETSHVADPNPPSQMLEASYSNENGG